MAKILSLILLCAVVVFFRNNSYKNREARIGIMMRKEKIGQWGFVQQYI